MGDEAAGPPFLCQLCSSSFRRLEHLQRHALSHTKFRPFACTFCPQSFNRRDVLVRHWAICKDRVKSGNDIPKLSQKRRGKKRQSCLPCHKLKRACNLKSPCNECAKRNIECIFTPLIREDTLNSNGDPSLQLMVSDVPTDPTLDTEVPLPDFSPLSMNDQPYPSFCMPDPIVNSWDCGHGDNLQLTLNSIPRSLASPSCPIWSQKLAFLAQFTRNTGLAASFDCGDVQLRQQLVLTFASGLSWIDSQPSDLQTTSPQQPLDQLDHQQNFRGDFSQLSEFPTVLEISTSWSKSNSTFSTADSKYSFSSSTDRMGRLWREWSGDPLAIKTHEIVVGIKRAVLNKRRKSCIALTWSVLLEEVCYHFFAPSNLKSFLMAFYSIWEPNWPAFHMATFNVADAPSTLIAGMALIGACLMPDHISQNAAVPWFEAVEEWVFDDDNFCEDPIEHETDDTKIRSRLDAVRAAYCVVLYQTWEGSEESKRRIRRTRYTHLINVSRSVGYSNACHGDLKRYVNEGPTLSNWRRFSLKEETIRTLTYVFLLDCAYGIFNNTAPRMVVHELQMELSSPEHIFQAKTPQSWFERVETWAESDIGRSRILVSDAVKVICDETLSPVTFQMFLQMTLLNFFTLIHAFHNLIFHLQCGLFTRSQAFPIEHGLSNWKRAWLERQMMDQGEESGKRVGFYRYTHEYWALACIVLKKLGSSQTTMISNGDTTGSCLSKVISEQYDESDMRRVRELIEAVEVMGLGLDDF